MSTSSALERTVDKVLSQKEADLITQIDSAYQEALTNIESSRTKLEAEYLRIVEGAKKQAENLKRQIVGSSRLAARNKQLLLIDTAVNNAFEKAKVDLASSNKEEKYRVLITRMLENSVSAIGSDEVIVECNKNDFDLVKKAITDLSKDNTKSKVKLSDQPINSIGGIRVRSADGSITYDNTLDSRIERFKPLIRKDIVQMLRGEK
ncbi:MAG TPA: V-type ATP synthase subunit E family protein [Nitrososphaeraceae archaeon]|nr:V-type ATP synthase subunit E family protein [Nitrososphaeraceae archaeon]